ncbi:MAG: hypothetical protein V8R51_00785 [Clostridia bacterium]
MIKRRDFIYRRPNFYQCLGANRSGIANILVKFIQAKDEVKRGKGGTMERVILKLYKRNKTFQNRIGNIIKEGKT